MSTDLYLVRHGHDQPAEDGTRRLTSLGRYQARGLGVWLARLPVDALLCSDLPRARETADLMCEGLDGGLLRIDEPRLREVDGSADDVPPRLRRSRDGADPWTSFARGVADVVGLVTQRFADGCVVLVCHSGAFDAVLELTARSEGRLEVHVDHAGVAHWRSRPGCPQGEWLLLGHNLRVWGEQP